MRYKQIKSLIKSNAIKSMPDVFDKIDLDVIMDDFVPVKKQKKLHSFNLNTVLKFASLLLIFTISSIFVINQLTDTENQVFAMDTEAEVIGFSSISAASFLDENELSGISLPLAYPLEYNPQSTLIESEMEVFNRYVNTIEVFLGNKTNFSYEMTDLNNHEYQKEITYKATDLIGNNLEYSIYYRIEKDSSTKNQYSLQGMILLGENTYQINGSFVLNKKVSQVEWTITSDTNKSIKITDAGSETTQKFRYSYYENNNLTNEVEIELFIENSNVSGKLKSQNNDLNVTYLLNRIHNQNSFDSLSVNYQYRKGMTSEDGQIDIEVEAQSEGQYGYLYKIKLQGSNEVVAEYQGRRNDFSQKDSNPGNGNGGNSNHGPGFNS